MNLKPSVFLFATALLIGACNPPQPASDFESVEDIETSVSEGLYHPEWVKSATIYEANIRQHTPEGTFNALREDLSRISDLGISVIWLMPIHPIGEKNRKGGMGSYYSVKDYKAVNPEFGTKEDFKALVEEAHSLDMNVIIDWVANHTAFDAVWAEKNKEWYTLDSAGNLMPPEGTDWTDTADLNYENDEMRAAMIDAMTYWVREFDIDGFRCDVADYVPVDFWETCTDSLRAVKRDILMLAEAENPELHRKAFNAAYAWEWLHIINGVASGEKTTADIDAYMETAPDALPNDAFKMYFTTNHDENSWNGTVRDRFGAGHLAYAALTFTIDGMPLVYSGQEAGLDKALAFFEKDEVEWGDYEYADFYRKLLMLNRNNLALWNGNFGGEFRKLPTGADDRVYAFTRSEATSGIVTVVNLSDETVTVTLEDLPEGNFRCIFDGVLLDEAFGGETELEPFEYHVFYNQ